MRDTKLSHEDFRKEIHKVARELIQEFTKQLFERLMLEEREMYLEENVHTKGNGYYERNLITPQGEIKGLKVPRTRDGNFRPALLPPPRQKAMIDIGELITLLFVAGVSTRKINKILETWYGIHYSPSSIARLTKVTEEEIERWRNRPLEETYLFIFVDATFLSIRRGTTAKEPVYVVMGIREDWTREILGFYVFAGGESAFLWREIANDLYRRGVRKVEMFIGDGLSGLEEALREIFPGADFQHCVVHHMRNCLKGVRKRDREGLAEDMKKIFRAKNREEAYKELMELKEKWGSKYPGVIKSTERNFHCLTAFMKYPEGIRRFIYSTNSIERRMKEIKRRTKVIEQFPGEGSVLKLLYYLLKEENDRLRSRTLPCKDEWEKFVKSRGNEVAAGRHT